MKKSIYLFFILIAISAPSFDPLQWSLGLIVEANSNVEQSMLQIEVDGITNIPNRGKLKIHPLFFCRDFFREVWIVSPEVSLNLDFGIGHLGEISTNFETYQTISIKFNRNISAPRIDFSEKDSFSISLNELSWLMFTNRSLQEDFSFYAISLELSLGRQQKYLRSIGYSLYRDFFLSKLAGEKETEYHQKKENELQGDAQRKGVELMKDLNRFSLERLDSFCEGEICFDISNLLSIDEPTVFKISSEGLIKIENKASTYQCPNGSSGELFVEVDYQR